MTFCDVSRELFSANFQNNKFLSRKRMCVYVTLQKGQISIKGMPIERPLKTYNGRSSHVCAVCFQNQTEKPHQLYSFGLRLAFYWDF